MKMDILMNGRKRQSERENEKVKLGLLCIDMPEIYGGGD
jgi:hypothetical protein